MLISQSSFLFHNTAPTQIYTLSLHDALPISTKFLNGHSDGVGGVVILNNEDDAAWIAFVQNGAGAILSPFDSWLDRKSTRLNSSHPSISYAVFCLKKKK